MFMHSQEQQDLIGKEIFMQLLVQQGLIGMERIIIVHAITGAAGPDGKRKGN